MTVKNLRKAGTIATLFLGAAIVALSPATAAAQNRALAMPSLGYNPIGFMTQMNNIGNQQVQQMFKLCATHPGACNGLATPQSLSNAIQGVQNQSISNAQHNLQNMNNQTRAISNTNCAITGGSVYYNNNTQQRECYR
jgi:hypothetical protein